MEIMSNPLNDEPEALIDDLTTVEAYNARIQYLAATANTFLDKASAAYISPKEEGRTEMDRKVELESAVSSYREVRDKLEAIADSIKTRISLGQSILKYETMFIERKQI